ncbi:MULTISPECIES: helix-turn-helix transcriptional regulator [unclassified Streptomyces]|uniref:helix-turn-helix domain-containing protein n=1 Tax=unclassified Streptomyces TaxID=2593676 RepID=UPI00081D51E1|nr:MULTISPECIES: helix-turn-helix transcriptional regulator [unclassified Streptomyces]MYZ35155.1 helix-turn-helix domain-containing protein [Streptomyces sp. SID4917]SCF73131.1 Transcriptional regulator, contains XRE-family HTH domain [Streptomyces sp. MnatMP-M17]
MSTAGQRVKDVRKRRGLSQRELADASGVSLSLIRKLEQGERETARLETLRKLAHSLRVPTMQLAGGPNPEDASEETVDRWTAVREALERPPLAAGLDDEPPTVSGVRAALRETEPLFSGDQFAALSVMLPPLLRDAEALGPEGRPVRVRLLQLAGWLMTQTRQFKAAETALERALDDSADRLEGAATVNTLCWLLLRQGELGKAYDLSVKWADDVEPRVSRATPAELSTWGWMLLRVSAAAVRNSQPGDAEDALKFATAAAVALGREYAPENDFLRTFGPTTVKLKAAENAGVIDRPDMVLRLAERIPFSGLKPTSNNRNRHLLDVSDALVKTGNYADAFGKLEQINADSPEWLPNQRYARDILGRVISGRRTLTAEMRTMADVVGLPL